MTQSNFLAGKKFTKRSDAIFWFAPLGKTKGIIKNVIISLAILEIDKEGFCYAKKSGEPQRIEFVDCKLIEEYEDA